MWWAINPRVGGLVVLKMRTLLAGGNAGGIVVPQPIPRKDFMPPENFAMVEPGVYRSAFPRMKNTSFLKRLKLKTVVPLVPEDYPIALAEFYEANGIKLMPFGLDGNKWPFKNIDIEIFAQALVTVLQPENRPVLIHCNKGKHRTGSLVGCIRKYRGWSLSCITAEYLLFAAPKSRLEDQRFIEMFDIGSIQPVLQAKKCSPPVSDENESKISEARGEQADDSPSTRLQQQPPMVAPEPAVMATALDMTPMADAEAIHQDHATSN